VVQINSSVEQDEKGGGDTGSGPESLSISASGLGLSNIAAACDATNKSCRKVYRSDEDRRAANRRSAKLSRDRQKKLMDELRTKIEELYRVNLDLSRENQELKKQVGRTQEEMQAYMNELQSLNTNTNNATVNNFSGQNTPALVPNQAQQRQQNLQALRDVNSHNIMQPDPIESLEQQHQQQQQVLEAAASAMPSAAQLFNQQMVMSQNGGNTFGVQDLSLAMNMETTLLEALKSGKFERNNVLNAAVNGVGGLGVAGEFNNVQHFDPDSTANLISYDSEPSLKRQRSDA